MKQHTVLVTGGAGAIGSNLVRRLCQEHRTLVVDDLSSGWYANIQGLDIEFWKGSVVDGEILDEVFEEKPSIVFHLAANFANQSSVDYPQKDLSVNGMGTLKLLKHAHRHRITRFIYTSSSCVYGEANGPISEPMLSPSLDTPYAITKLLGEHYVDFFRTHHGLPTVVLRLFNSYGPGDFPGKYRSVIPNYLQRVHDGQSLVITGTGDETRDFTYVEDTVSALCAAMAHPRAIGQTFNTGTGVETSIRDLARSILDISGKEVPIEFRPRRNWDSVTRRCADITKIRSILGFHPSTDIRQGLEKTYRWYIENLPTRPG